MRAFLLVVVSGCGTLHGEGAGDRNLPTAGMGPFRALEEGEVDQAPFISPSRTPVGRVEVVRLADGTFALYRGEERDGARSIVRETSVDGLAFGDPVTVLEDASAPSVVPIPGGLRLFYESSSGIAASESADGLAFEAGADVLVAEAAWEGGRVGAPSVVPDAGGGLLLYYEAARGIGVASSAEGATFARVGDGPIVEPAASGEWDDRSVSDPAARVHVSPTGRRTVQLFYVGVAAAPSGEDPEYGVGAAASFDGRAFERSAGGPVLERPRAIVGLGAPVSIGPADLLPFIEERSSGTGVGGALSPAEIRFAPPE